MQSKLPSNFNKAVERARRYETNVKVAGSPVAIFNAHTFILKYIRNKSGEKIAESYRKTAESYEPFTIGILEGLKKVGLLPKEYETIARRIAEKNRRLRRLFVFKEFGTTFPQIEKVFPAKIHELPLDKQIDIIARIENGLRKILTQRMLDYMRKSIISDIMIKRTGKIPARWKKISKERYLRDLNIKKLNKNLGVINRWQERIGFRRL